MQRSNDGIILTERCSPNFSNKQTNKQKNATSILQWSNDCTFKLIHFVGLLRENKFGGISEFWEKYLFGGNIVLGGYFLLCYADPATDLFYNSWNFLRASLLPPTTPLLTTLFIHNHWAAWDNIDIVTKFCIFAILNHLSDLVLI